MAEVVVDASVWTSYVLPADPLHRQSRTWLDAWFVQGQVVGPQLGAGRGRRRLGDPDPDALIGRQRHAAGALHWMLRIGRGVSTWRFSHMVAVQIADLKERAGEIVRRLQETGEPVEIIEGGEVVAKLVPAFDELSKDISAHWPEGVSAVDAIRADRRDL